MAFATEKLPPLLDTDMSPNREVTLGADLTGNNALPAARAVKRITGERVHRAVSVAYVYLPPIL